MKKLMCIKYTKKEYVDRLDTCLKMCCMPHVTFKEYNFANGDALYKIYIDKGQRAWGQVKAEVNRVHPTKFYYESGVYIENGKLYINL